MERAKPPTPLHLEGSLEGRRGESLRYIKEPQVRVGAVEKRLGPELVTTRSPETLAS